MTKSQWINRIAIGGTILLASIGGLWLWDAKDYPIPGIDSSKVDSTEIKPNWRWWRGLTFAENIKANQLWLRRERSQRLQKKRVLNLSLKESYWELEQFYGTSQSPGTTIVYFDNNGGIEARNKLGLPDAFKGVSGYQRPQKNIIIFERKSKNKTERFSIGCPDEEFLFFWNELNDKIIYLRRLSDPTAFDSLPKSH